MKNWYNEIPKRLHQSRIGEDIKRSIRTLSIIEDTSISDVTERALRTYVESQKDRLQDWHQQQSRVVN